MATLSGSDASGRFERSAARFVGFFEELRGAFVEREDVLTQIALALLGREHVLMTGPPGTAKSQLARAVLGRILDAKTGEPSLFARQFTENTVLTDLVGAIDFKTLMETGRSEHFTDDGIMGSVHAFLDEVFDGRDMLLRSTLNLLGERELKQGKRTTHGRVECSLMTTNRYLAEVLEESRESLLAFVDRIAFLSFVPKGFASEESMRLVMRQSLSTTPLLRAYLTIQDVDVLQEAAELVRMPPEACDRLVSFLGLFEAEMAAAVRATPDFAPSRYLSTRTRVRAGKLLRSIALYRKLFREPNAPLSVTPADFESLRLVLLLSGPPRELAAQLSKEQDPREARQIKIVETERDVFERTLARLDRSPWLEAAPATAVPSSEALQGLSVDDLLARLQQATVERASDATFRALAQLSLQRIIEEGLSPQSGGPQSLAQTERLLDHVERTRGPVDPLAHWLRERCLTLLEGAIERTSLTVEGLSATHHKRGVLLTLELLSPIVEQLLTFARDAERLRDHAPSLDTERVAQLLEISAAAVANRLHEAFFVEVRGVLAQSGPSFGLSELAGPRLRTVLEALDEFATRATEVHPSFAELLDGVARGALSPLTTQALSPLAQAAPEALVPAFDALWQSLTAAHVARYLPPDEVLAVALSGALQQEKLLLAGVTPVTVFSAESYAALRRQMPRSLLSYAAVELCLRLDKTVSLEFARSPRLAPFAARVGRLPSELRASLWGLDKQLVSRAIEFFKGWLAQAALESAAASDLFSLLSVLEHEEVSARIRLESELIEAVFPEAATDCAVLRARLADLLARVRAAVQARSTRS